MDKQLKNCLENQTGDYIFPFLWLHGESHEEIREEILAIKQSGCLSFCAESRPHPDFCGEQWWADFEFILQTAEELGMQVWLLDDAHYPTGFAGGAIERGEYPRKKHLICEKFDFLGPQKETALLYEPLLQEGDSLLAAVAYRRSGNGIECCGEPIDLTPTAEDGLVYFDIPEGLWRVFYLIESRRPISKRPNYIDMLDPDSTHLMIEKIYQPHYDHFASYFGNTFRGFFSDEPSFRNSEHNTYFGTLGTHMPLPWNDELPSVLAKKLNISEKQLLPLLPALWAETGSIADLRAAYMDTVTALYKKNFSMMLGDWCRAHGVEYIGHIIEDMGASTRLSCSAGHFFRSMDGQDMAGIDVVLHQIIPGHNDLLFSRHRNDKVSDPTFFVYALAKLGSSHAHLNPQMKNRAMCEIFGAFGYAEGLPFMKKLVDHMLAGGINRFVPHAFTPKYPDPDCPPHFYRKGNNHSFDLFGDLIRYTQRVIHLLEGGKHQAPIALYYNAECEWAGDTTDTYFSVAKVLTQNQLDFDFVSEDYLTDATLKDGKLCINEEQYQLLILPGCRYITPRLRGFLEKMEAEAVPFYFRGTAPEGFEAHLEAVIPCELRLATPAPDLRYYHVSRDGKEIYLFKNDGETAVDTTVELLPEGTVTVYDAWSNTLSRQDHRRLLLAAGESILWIFGEQAEGLPTYCHPHSLEGGETVLLWDITAGEQTYTASPLFNLNGRGELTRFFGKIQYKTEIELPEDAKMLDLGFVGETARLTLNGIDCGARIAPPYAFNVQKAMHPGKNRLKIEVTNNPAYLERDIFSVNMKLSPGGLLGPVKILK